MRRQNVSKIDVRFLLLLAVIGGLLFLNLTGCGGLGSSAASNVDPTSDDNPHASSTYVEYPGNCLGCHADQASEILNTVHYQYVGATPDMVNNGGQPQGKLTNSVNSYCINILGDWPVCGSCHVGQRLAHPS